VVVPATVTLVAVIAVAVVLTVCTAAAELTATQALMRAADDSVRVSGAAALCRDGACFLVGRAGSDRGGTGKRESSDKRCDASPGGTQSSLLMEARPWAVTDHPVIGTTRDHRQFF
jgi:hypothetical protein